MRILVTDGDNRAALSIVRSLGEKCHQLLVGEVYQPCLASSSKYCHERFVYPDPVHAGPEFIKTLQQQIVDRAVDVVLPVSDITTCLVTENKKILGKCCHIPFPDFEVVKRAASKYEVIKAAQQLGIAIPRTHFVDTPEQASSIPCDWPFPLVIKPNRSRIRDGSRWISTGVSYAYTIDELRLKVESSHRLEFPLLIQERIEGPGVGVFLCYHHGKSIACFAHRRLREKPPSGGVSVLRESIALPPLAKADAERLLDHLQWHGVAMVEFKIDQRNNLPVLMEVNGRFWGSLQLAIDSGIDFPSILVDTINNDNPTPVFSYKVGVKTRWFWGDVDVLIMLLTKKRSQLNLSKNYPGTFRSIFNFLKFFAKDLHYEIWSVSDPRPAIYETLNWFKTINKT